VSAEVQYAVTYVNSALVESNPSTFTATTTVTSAAVGLSDIPVAPASFGVASRRIYRMEDGGDPLRVAEINDNTTTTYLDNIGSDDLGAAPPSDNYEPPSYSHAIYHQDRLFVIDPLEGIVNYS